MEKQSKGDYNDQRPDALKFFNRESNMENLLQRHINRIEDYAVIIIDKDGYILTWNAGAEKIKGYSASEITGRHISLFYLPGEIESGEPKHDLKIASSMGHYESEAWRVRKNGEKCRENIVTTTLFEDNGVLSGYSMIIKDITRHVSVEDDLRFSEASLKEAQRLAKIGSWTWEPEKDIPTWSEEMFHIFGLDPKGPPANFKEVSKYYTPESWQILQAAVQKTVNEGIPYEVDVELVRKDRSNLWATCRGEAIRDSHGKIGGLRGTVQDIHERKMAEKIQRESEMIKHADRMKSLFLANMSHELRTPLNSIIGFSEVLKDGLMGELTEQQRKYIGNIYSSGEHLLSLINDILDLSKVESGKMALDLEPVDTAALLSQCLSMVKEKALKHSINLVSDFSEDMGACLVDSRKVKQIVFNLLSNAIKFTDDGGKIILSSKRVQRSDTGKLRGKTPGRTFDLPGNEFPEFIEICVTDTGIGIPPQALDQLFQAFIQIDSGFARRYEGTGLGLALVKQMAELHGGSVMVQSSHGQGSQFTVWLPMRLPGQPRIFSQDYMKIPEVKKRPGKKQMVLVLEDDDHAAELIKIQLEAENLEVFHVKSAEAALTWLREATPDLITLDILLPGMDGWEFLGRIKQIQPLAKIPVVIISVVSNENKGISLGASAVLQKPIGREELHNTLADMGFNAINGKFACKILVVDDDPGAVEILGGHLNTPGFEVIRAYGGREAIEAAHQLKPDLILLDLMMPGVNGFDVVEDLKSHEDSMKIPIVIVTAKMITEKDREELKGHVINILGKSEFNHGRFLNEVRRALSINPEIR